MGQYADVVMTGSSEGNNGMRRPIGWRLNMDTEIGYQGKMIRGDEGIAGFGQ